MYDLRSGCTTYRQRDARDPKKHLATPARWSEKIIKTKYCLEQGCQARGLLEATLHVGNRAEGQSWRGRSCNRGEVDPQASLIRNRVLWHEVKFIKNYGIVSRAALKDSEGCEFDTHCIDQCLTRA